MEFVDITNFELWPRSPLHAYNADLISKVLVLDLQIKVKIIYGKDYILDQETCVIADSEKALGIAGIIGGEKFGSEIDTKIFLLNSILILSILQEVEEN